MPFTFSHPAIILPLSKVSKTKLSLTGLITGSLAPDFEYFICLQMRRTYGHDMNSFFWFNLPLCVGLAFIFHMIVKTPLTNSLPHFLYMRLVKYIHFNWFLYFKTYWIVFIYSAAIGVFSHLLWDSFTHDHGIFGKSPAILFRQAPIINIPLFCFLQWLSSIFGALTIMRTIYNLPIEMVPKSPVPIKNMYWLHVLTIMCFIFIVEQPTGISGLIAVTIGSFLYGIVGSSIFFKIYEKIYSNRNIKL
jgi:hypothetical protein